MRRAKELPEALAGLALLDVSGSAYLETLAPAPGAQVLASAPTGEPAAVMNTFGKGRAVLLGTFVSVALEQDPIRNATAGRLIAALIRGAGVTPRVKIHDVGSTGRRDQRETAGSGWRGAVEARLMESDRALLLVAINHDTTPRRVAIELPPDVPGGEWQDLETAEAVPLFSSKEGGPRFEHAFAARDVLVLLARKP